MKLNELNQSTLDEWIFEYLEGNLDAAHSEELQAYLQQYPDFLAEFEAWQRAYVQPEPVAYPHPEALSQPAVGLNLGKLGWIGLSSVVISVAIGSILAFGPRDQDRSGIVSIQSNAATSLENMQLTVIPQNDFAHVEADGGQEEEVRLSLEPVVKVPEQQKPMEEFIQVAEEYPVAREEYLPVETIESMEIGQFGYEHAPLVFRNIRINWQVFTQNSKKRPGNSGGQVNLSKDGF